MNRSALLAEAALITDARKVVKLAPQFRLGYRPSLDGMRGVAVMAVMGLHNYVPFCAGGTIGVDIFFVLSGFLITSLLLEEWNRSGRISFRDFYIRRALRLLPALFVFLLVLQAYVLLRLRGSDFWQMERATLAVLGYVANWAKAFGVDLRALNHAWSLSIEEQFYFVWPAAFWLMLRFRRSPRWIVCALALAIAGIALRRALMYEPALETRIFNGSDTRFDELLAGCLLAVGLGAGLIRAFRALPYLVLAAIILILWGIYRPIGWGRMARFGWVALEISVGLIMLYLVTRSGTLLHRVLEARWLVWVGRVSYGLYLWHAPVGSKVGGWPLPDPLKPLVGFALSFAVAGISYRWVEQPFLKRKAKLQGAVALAAKAA